ncbi:MAG TPA: metallophosphoesterase [Smithellaceae bacterium]|nr:metallophosphoesterase [Smithellaceae bacterium]HRS88590.1 metallophosphoesterase [Smithellaceae bacterium]HRV25344.1 metallophosphoesterase [Smithellaceae bacterium]
MGKTGHRYRNIFAIIILTILMVTLLLAFALEVYTVIVKDEGDMPLPPTFGNFPANRKALEQVKEAGNFSFAAVGDARSSGIFERIVSEMHKEPLDFVVLLGDLSGDNNEEHHRYLHAEMNEYVLPCPMFYVVGNHDVDPQSFPIERFEKIYGSSIFSFEYRKCLFIVLRILDSSRFNNKESLAFLEKFRNIDLSRYLHTFVFFHVPPSSISTYFYGKQFVEEKALLRLIDELGIEYAINGDFHGFGQCKRKKTTYIVTGGGGASLRHKPNNQFYHAAILHVTPDSVGMRILSVPHTADFEDDLEQLAIVHVWPWMRHHIALVVILNLLGAVIFLCLAYLLVTVTKKIKPEKISAGG